MNSLAFTHTALALFAGIFAQALAAHIRVPGIVVLLLTGVAIGPDGLGLFDPEALGGARTDIITFAVTIILFEGSLALRFHELRRVQRELLLLLTVGAAVSTCVGALASWWFLDFPWPVALLYGTLMIVTGPTVVTPLLSRLTVDKPVRDLLVSEGVLGDPVGALIAIVTAEYLLGHSGGGLSSGVAGLALPLLTGSTVGAGAGLLLHAVLRRELVHEDMRNAVVLGSVLVAAALASQLSAEAGLMSAVAQGVVLGNTSLRGLRSLQQFKEELTLILLSFLFIVLTADLQLHDIWAVGWPSALVVATLVWVGRPLAVMLCTIRSDLTWKQRAFVAWLCPRGIVAASIAGLFGILLTDAGIAGGNQLVALVFVTVFLTVTVQGIAAPWVARLLDIDTPQLQGALIISAGRFGRLIARLLSAHGRHVVLVDRSPTLCRQAKAEGLAVYEGDALSPDVLEEAGAQYCDTVIAATTNTELNVLIAQRVTENFPVARVLPLNDPHDVSASEQGHRPLPGNFPGTDVISRHLRQQRLILVTYSVPSTDIAGMSLGALPYGPDEFAILLQHRDRAIVATADLKLAKGDRLICARPHQGTSPLTTLLTTETTAPATAHS